ncbi:NAD(P)/FAD-dependent oxidoreductase, partial [Streptomyces exfoliatus]
RWPGEIAKLEELGARNLDGIEEAVARHGIDCDFERTGEIVAATRPHELADLRAWHRRTEELGLGTPEFLDREQVRAEVDSPAFLGGLFDRRGVAMLHPAKLAWGLKRACLRLGVRVHEHTPGLDLARSGAGIAVRTPYGRVFARRAALGTNVFPSLVARLRPYT